MVSPQSGSGACPGVVRPSTLSGLFEEYAAYSLRVRGTSPDTVAERVLYFERAASALSARTASDFFSALNPLALMRAMADYGADHGPGSRRWMHLTLRSILKFCYLRGYVPSDYSEWVAPPRRCRLSGIPRSLPEEAIAGLLSGIDCTSPGGYRDLAIVRILSTYGVRGWHTRHLKLSDIDWEGCRISFAACKRGRHIVQHLTAEVGNSILDYLRMGRPSGTEHSELFLGTMPPHRPFIRSAELSNMIAVRIREVGISVPEGVSHGTHGFRHAFASRLCGKVPHKHISDMLGHRDFSSVMVYAKVDFDGLAQAALPWPEEDVQ